MRISILAMLFGAMVISAGCASTPQQRTQRAESLYHSARQAETAKNVELAAKEYEKALREDPNHVPSIYALAQLRTLLKQYDEAIALWRRYVTAEQGSADAYNDLAYCQDLAGWPVAAESSYKKAIVADPRHHIARVNYGLLLARHGRAPEGLCQLQTVLSPAEAHYNIALAFDEVGKKSAAQAEYRKAIELDPKFIDVRAHLQAGESTARTD